MSEPALQNFALLTDAMNDLADARARIAAVRALCTARVPHPDRGAVPGQAYEATLRVRLIDTDVVLAALDGDPTTQGDGHGP